MNRVYQSLIIGVSTGILLGVPIGLGVADYIQKQQQASIQSDTPKQCTLKIGNALVQGTAYDE